ncbi:MAG: beta-galactosidase, partial [Lentisphaerae bacterium]|nr:beta-galactosidase [Lentisphaerota bacterium]
MCMEALGLYGTLDATSIIGASSLRRFGVDSVLTEISWQPGGIGEEVERRHLRNVFYSLHLGEREITTDFSKPNDGLNLSEKLDMVKQIAETGKLLDLKKFPPAKDWFSPEFLNYQIEKTYIPSAKFGSPLYMLNSENSLLGEPSGKECSGFSESDTKHFQTWCRKEYGDDLTALNKEWNTKFTSWDQVCGIMFNEAAANNQLPRWVDFRFFMRSEVFTALHVAFNEMIRRFVPNAQGADMGWANFDYNKMRKLMTARSAAGGISDLGGMNIEIHQSFSGDKSFIFADGNTLRWDDELKTPLNNARYPWKYLFLGCNGLKIGMEQYDSLGGCSYLTADYSEALPFFKNISKELITIQSGIGKVVSNATPYRSEVAILWAPRNHYISRLIPLADNSFSGGAMYNTEVGGGAHEDAMILMNSLQLRPTFIGPEDLDDKEVIGKYKAILLPYSRGMSVKEAAAIEAFVKKGGLVIASNEPGTHSEHGKPLEVSRLSKLFPVTDKKNIVKYGAGYAVYLPDAINGYHKRLIAGDYSGSDAVAELLKKYAGIVPPVVLTDVAAKGIPVRNTLAAVFTDGPAKYLGLLRYDQNLGDKTTGNINIKLNGTYYVWDVRDQKSLGKKTEMNVELDMYPHFYAMLPVCPLKMSLTPEKSSVRGGETLNVNGKVEFADNANASGFKQVVNVKVYSPEGKPLEFFNVNVLFSGASFEIKLPVSYSEKAGAYKVVARNPITGMQAEAAFTVVNPGESR